MTKTAALPQVDPRNFGGAYVVTRNNGSRYLEASGGHRNQDTVDGNQIDLTGELHLIGTARVDGPEDRTGSGSDFYAVFRDDTGPILVNSYIWGANSPYCWRESWITAERIEESNIERYLGRGIKQKVSLESILQALLGQ